MSDNNEERIIHIVDSNVDRLNHEIAKLNRRADKINCPHVDYRILETNMVPDPYTMAKAQEHYAPNVVPKAIVDQIPLVRQHKIEIVGDGPKIEGWKFVGTLDHYTIPGKVIVNTVPGESVPSRYFEHEATCDHCQKIRRRVETFVLEGVDEHEGEWMLVGRNCLRDFFGHDPMQVVRFLNRLWKFVDSLEDDEWSGAGGGRYEHYYSSMAILATTVAVIRTFGWVAKSKATEEQTASSHHVSYALNPPLSAKPYAEWQQFIRSLKTDKVEDENEARAAIAWLKEQSDTNEYMHNLKLLEDQELIPAKMLGYWASLIAAYQRAQSRLEYQKRQRKLNAHYGEEGQRIVVRVKCAGVRFTESYYGTVAIHRMWTEEGHTLVWFANTDAKMVRGGEYTVRATIKKHDEYQSWKQTNVTRLVVLEEHETEDENNGS